MHLKNSAYSPVMPFFFFPCGPKIPFIFYKMKTLVVNRDQPPPL